MSEEQANALRERLGLNRPLYIQYFDFLWDMVTLDFGTALTQGERPILDELGERMPATIELTIPAIAITAVIGIFSGAYAAKNRKKPVDYVIRLLSIVAYSIPVFFMGLIFQIVFSVRLPIFPLAGRMDTLMMTTFESRTHFYVIDAILAQNWKALGSVLMHLVLPSVTLGLALSGVFVRLTRVNMIEMLQSDFITAAGHAFTRDACLQAFVAQHIHPDLDFARAAVCHFAGWSGADGDNFLLAGGRPLPGGKDPAA